MVVFKILVLRYCNYYLNMCMFLQCVMIVKAEDNCNTDCVNVLVMIHISMNSVRTCLTNIDIALKI